MLKASEGEVFSSLSFCSSFQSLPAENWKERRPKEELVLGVTREIYLLERVLQVGAAMVTSSQEVLSICGNSFKTVVKAFQVMLVERIPRVCKAVIKAKGNLVWLLNGSMCYFIVLMSSLLLYNVEVKINPRMSRCVHHFHWSGCTTKSH